MYHYGGQDVDAIAERVYSTSSTMDRSFFVPCISVLFTYLLVHEFVYVTV
jgi:hypothetical protein